MAVAALLDLPRVSGTRTASFTPHHHHHHHQHAQLIHGLIGTTRTRIGSRRQFHVTCCFLSSTPHRAVRDSTPSQATAARSTNRRAKLEVPTSLLISRLHANSDNTSRRTRRPEHTSPPQPYSSSPASLQLPPRRPWNFDQPDRQAPRRSLSNHNTSQAITRRHAGRQPYARPCIYR